MKSLGCRTGVSGLSLTVSSYQPFSVLARGSSSCKVDSRRSHPRHSPAAPTSFSFSHSGVSSSFAILWTGAHQAPLSMEFPRWEYWSGLPCSSPGDLPGPGIKPTSPASPEFFTTEPQGSPALTSRPGFKELKGWAQAHGGSLSQGPLGHRIEPGHRMYSILDTGPGLWTIWYHIFMWRQAPISQETPMDIDSPIGFPPSPGVWTPAHRSGGRRLEGWGLTPGRVQFHLYHRSTRCPAQGGQATGWGHIGCAQGWHLPPLPPLPWYYFSCSDVTHSCGSFDTFNCSALPTPIKFSHPLILALGTF